MSQRVLDGKVAVVRAVSLRATIDALRSVGRRIVVVGQGSVWTFHGISLYVLSILLNVFLRLLVHKRARNSRVFAGSAAKATLLILLFKQFLVDFVCVLEATFAVLQIADRAAKYQLGVIHLEHFF